jgi:hypothetical protein
MFGIFIGVDDQMIGLELNCDGRMLDCFGMAAKDNYAF